MDGNKGLDEAADALRFLDDAWTGRDQLWTCATPGTLQEPEGERGSQRGQGGANRTARTARANLVDIRLEHQAPLYDLAEDVVHLVEMKDEVELAHVFKGAVERLDKDLDEIQDTELGLGAVDDKAAGGILAGLAAVCSLSAWAPPSSSSHPTASALQTHPSSSRREQCHSHSHEVQRRIVPVDNPRIVVLPLHRPRAALALVPPHSTPAHAHAPRPRRPRYGKDQLGRVEKVAHAGRAVRDQREDLGDEGLLCQGGEGGVELGQPGLAWGVSMGPHVTADPTYRVC